MAITVRFNECTRYDINIDSDVMLFMATTNKGSYYVEVPIEGALKLRENRQQFKDKAVELIQRGVNPCQVEL